MIFTPPWYFSELGRQLIRIGYFSLPVVGMTALFTGGALALQVYAGGESVSTPNPWSPISSPLR